MIRRADGSDWLLVTQAAHAWMAGTLAAAWGNERFSLPEPAEALRLATRLHDVGWLATDAMSTIDDQGRPANFLDTALEDAVRIWGDAVESVAQFDPYAALLVSMHASTVYRRRLERGVDPPADQERIHRLLAGLEAERGALADRLRAHPLYFQLLGESQMRAAYRCLRVCDLLSLILLSDSMPQEGTIGDVPGASLEERVSIRYRRREPFTLLLDPSPFSGPLNLSVPARRLPRRPFANTPSYRKALAAAEWETIETGIALF